MRMTTLSSYSMVNAAQFVWEETCPEKRWSFITGATPNTPERPSTIRLYAFFYRSYNNIQISSHTHTTTSLSLRSTEELKKSANSLEVSPASCVSLVLLDRAQNTSNVVETMQYIMTADASYLVLPSRTPPLDCGTQTCQCLSAASLLTSSR